MTSIYDIPYEDIQKFLDANGETFKNKNDAYDKTLDLLNDKNSKGHTTSIIEWIMAHNLLINKINIPYYTINYIDNMSQVDINDLAKLLKMKGNNIKNIKNILKYFHKLRNEEEFLIKDVNENILNTLTQLEIQDIDVSKLSYNDVINLLKTHRNKKAIRKFIYDNLEKIIIYNSLYIDFSNDIGMTFLSGTNIYNKNIFIEILMDHEEGLKKYYTDKALNNVIKTVKENNNDEDGEVYIRKSKMDDLINFTFSLIDINEIILAKKVFNIANELHYFGRSYSYNQILVEKLMYSDIKLDVLKSIINFMGEDGFSTAFEEILLDQTAESISKFLENLTKLEKYDLLITILEIYININEEHKVKIIKKVLPVIKKAIKSKDNNLIIKYIKSFNI